MPNEYDLIFFSYFIKHKAQVVNVLSKRYILISFVQTRILGFEWIKNHYENDHFLVCLEIVSKKPMIDSLERMGIYLDMVIFCIPLGTLKETLLGKHIKEDFHGILKKLKP